MKPTAITIAAFALLCAAALATAGAQAADAPAPPPEEKQAEASEAPDDEIRCVETSRAGRVLEKDGERIYIAPDDIPYADGDSYEAAKVEPQSANLLVNGSFEKGRYWPYLWDPTDGLGIFWIDGGTDGKRCMRLYTDVLDEQWVKWNDYILKLVEAATKSTKGKPQILPKNPVPPAPERLPTHPPYYDTVGGLHGIHYRSVRVPIEPRAIYRVTLDARTVGGGSSKIFTKGFFHQAKYNVWRNAGRATLALHGLDSRWRRWSYVFHPHGWSSTIEDEKLPAECLQVQLYAYWPQGDYFYDNVRLEIVGYEEPEPEQPAPDETERKPEKRVFELDEDGFPVIK